MNRTTLAAMLLFFLYTTILRATPTIPPAGHILDSRGNSSFKTTLIHEERMGSSTLPGMNVYLGDEIETGEKSAIKAVLDKMIINTHADTRFVIDEFTESKLLTIKLLKGTILFQIRSGFPIIVYDIVLNNKTARVRSGDFLIKFDKSRLELVCFSGRVDLYLNEIKVNTIPSIVLHKRQSFSIEEEKINNLKDLSQGETLAIWNRYHLALDYTGYDIDTTVPFETVIEGWNLHSYSSRKKASTFVFPSLLREPYYITNLEVKVDIR